MQIAANILVAASTILLVGLGFSLIFTVTRFFHFAHGIVFTAAAYVAFALQAGAGLPGVVAWGLAVVAAGLLGAGIEAAVYRPLRAKGGSALVLLLASLGVYFLLQNAISMTFGDDTKQLRTATVAGGIDLAGARLTSVQLATFGTAALLVAGVAVLLRTSRLGRAMRAVACDPTLADVCGVRSYRVILWTFTLGSALAGVAGVLVALDVDMTPTMGMNALMMGVVAVIIGGVGSIPGIALGALLLATAQQTTTWFFGSQWQEVVAFLVLVVFLLFRPRGFLGARGVTGTA